MPYISVIETVPLGGMEYPIILLVDTFLVNAHFTREKKPNLIYKAMCDGWCCERPLDSRIAPIMTAMYPDIYIPSPTTCNTNSGEDEGLGRGSVGGKTTGPLPSLLLMPEVQADWNVQTPSKRAHSVEPPASSPMSVMDPDPDPVTPTKPKRGRPVFTPVTRKLTARLSKLGRHTIQTPEISQETKTIMDQIHERRTTKQEAAAATAKLKEEEEERVAAAERKAILIEKTKRAQELVGDVLPSPRCRGIAGGSPRFPTRKCSGPRRLRAR
ncbi:hypothetical protein C8J57DRAFT_1510751 [Mycena rebaudengoi]|nr:hypothetical protein C8J57DRAFT_1510751 [Mycena rebaudengoi]